MIEGRDPVRAYPIAPPREVRRERARAGVVGEVWRRCLLVQYVVEWKLVWGSGVD